MKQINIYLAVLLSFTGCINQVKPDNPGLKSLKDVSYEVDSQGAVKLNKTYIDKTEETEVVTETISKSEKEKKYEIVPNFEKKYNSSLNLDKKINKIDKKIIIKGGKVKISVDSIPINEFIDLVFSNVFKLNYTTDSSIDDMKNPITLNMTNLQVKQEVFDVVKKLLSINGVKIKKIDGVLFISKSDKELIDSSEEGIFIGYGRKVKEDIPNDEKIIMFVPYHYVNPRAIIRTLSAVGISKLKYDNPTQVVQMITGLAGDIRRAIKVINLIDRPYMEGQHAYLVKFKNIEINDFITRITGIYANHEIPVALSPLQRGVILNPIQEINSIYVISPKQSWIDMLVYWKEKIDIESEISPLPKFYTYKVKNRKADELADALNSVVELKLASNVKTAKKQKKLSNKTNKTNEIKINKIDHTIKADLATNMLMMQLLPSEYREVLPLIEKLDALPLQVLTEVTLAEVTLTDTFSLGFEYALKNNEAVGASLSTSTSAAITAAFGGSGFGATYASKNLNVVMNTFAEDKLLNILSKPKILILNNETGSISIGTQIPIITSETSASDIGGAVPSINRNISYQNTGVQVGLTPTINSNGIVTMSVSLTLSEAQLNDTSGIDSPLIVNRTLTTSLTLKNGETVMLGGLISKNKSRTDGGVPILMNIPWLGSIFKNQSEKIVKTELIMLIRPSIIKTPIEMSEKTRKYRSLLRLLDKYSLF